MRVPSPSTPSMTSVSRAPMSIAPSSRSDSQERSRLEISSVGASKPRAASPSSMNRPVSSWPGVICSPMVVDGSRSTAGTSIGMNSSSPDNISSKLRFSIAMSVVMWRINRPLALVALATVPPL